MTQSKPLVDQCTAWLVTDAPRRLAPATVLEYRRHLTAFEAWLETTLGILFCPDQITAYRMERYLAELEAQVRRLGHSSLTTTRRYAKASMQELAAAVEALYDA